MRLQGFEAGGPVSQWVGFSQFLPGGGAGPDQTPFEKVCVVPEGEMTVLVRGVETVPGPLDSCAIAPGEVREIVNRPTMSARCWSSFPVAHRDLPGCRHEPAEPAGDD